MHLEDRESFDHDQLSPVDDILAHLPTTFLEAAGRGVMKDTMLKRGLAAAFMAGNRFSESRVRGGLMLCFFSSHASLRFFK
jgi:hypothetical protein